jgi:ankyrin repeat protein
MILATMKGSIDLVKCLVEKGSNTNEENHEGETPLH